jgi:tRNA nucleotidyltransferase/poly(A) polymerase
MHGKSFKDDPTRILRAARYAVRLGFQFESLTQDLVDQAIAADVFKTLTAPRYFLELSRILEEQDPVPALDLLAAWGAVRYIPYETAARGRLAAAAANGWQVRLGAILKGLPSAEIDALFIAFNISHVDRKKITGALQAL